MSPMLHSVMPVIACLCEVVLRPLIPNMTPVRVIGIPTKGMSHATSPTKPRIEETLPFLSTSVSAGVKGAGSSWTIIGTSFGRGTFATICMTPGFFLLRGILGFFGRGLFLLLRVTVAIVSMAAIFAGGFFRRTERVSVLFFF